MGRQRGRLTAAVIGAHGLLMAARALLFSILACAAASVAQADAPAESARSQAAEARVSARLGAALTARGLHLGAPVFLRIIKQPATLSLFVAGADGRYALYKIYPICAFSGALGPKRQAGDGQAPEGFYEVPAGRLNPDSRFHLSFDLGYPNAHDRAQGWTGSALMVHGDCVSIGCYAMGDAAIEEIWTAMAAAYRGGQSRIKVHAFPFPMTDAAMAAHAGDPNSPFWDDLKRGADAFERSGTPPDIRVRKGRYALD